MAPEVRGYAGGPRSNSSDGITSSFLVIPTNFEAYISFIGRGSLIGVSAQQRDIDAHVTAVRARLDTLRPTMAAMVGVDRGNHATRAVLPSASVLSQGEGGQCLLTPGVGNSANCKFSPCKGSEIVFSELLPHIQTLALNDIS